MQFRVAMMIAVFTVIAFFGSNSASSAAEWESTLAAAKKEGKVAVLTDVTATLRDAKFAALSARVRDGIEATGGTEY